MLLLLGLQPVSVTVTRPVDFLPSSGGTVHAALLTVAPPTERLSTVCTEKHIRADLYAVVPEIPYNGKPVHDGFVQLAGCRQHAVHEFIAIQSTGLQRKAFVDQCLCARQIVLQADAVLTAGAFVFCQLYAIFQQFPICVVHHMHNTSFLIAR